MRKVCAIPLALALAASTTLSAATLAGVTLPDTVSAAGKTLVLNGLGLRSRMMVKVYVAGLYLEQKSADGAAIVNADTPKRIVLHFVRNVSNTQIRDAIVDGFDPGAKQSLKAEIDRFTGAFEAFAPGDEMTITYVPGSGTQLNVKGQDKLTVPGVPFAKALFGIWLGDNPPSASLKSGLLGK
jgi:hypothetical protein